MSAYAKKSNASEQLGAEDISANFDRISPKLIDKRFKANLELLNEYISTLTQLLNQLVQDNSAKLLQRQVVVLIAHKRLFHRKTGATGTSPDIY